MALPFEIIWKRIKNQLKEGQSIRYWGKARGYNSEKTFMVAKITNSYIICDPPNAKNLQRVPKQDFEDIWQMWGQYLLEKVRRYELRDISRFSSYIISIFHHLD